MFLEFTPKTKNVFPDEVFQIGTLVQFFGRLEKRPLFSEILLLGAVQSGVRVVNPRKPLRHKGSHRIVIPVVVGSSPISHPTEFARNPCPARLSGFSRPYSGDIKNAETHVRVRESTIRAEFPTRHRIYTQARER